jgi:hypothetical protein
MPSHIKCMPQMKLGTDTSRCGHAALVVWQYQAAEPNLVLSPHCKEIHTSASRDVRLQHHLAQLLSWEDDSPKPVTNHPAIPLLGTIAWL